jgi:hypothetical protein
MKAKTINVEKEKLKIIKWVTSLKDPTAIERLKMLSEKPQKKNDWWDELADEEKAAIDKGLEDLKAGRVKSHQEARRLYEKWL